MIFGRLFWFCAGAWAGVLAKQVYDIPDLPFPGEAVEKAKELLEDMKKDSSDGEESGAARELRDAMNKLKELEQKYRKGGDK